MVAPARRPRPSRRLFLAALGAPLALNAQQPAASHKGQLFPAEARRYVDAATEFPVLRLTDPACRSLLAPLPCRALAHGAGFLIYSSDRTGSLQVFRMDLKTGESRQLTEASALDPDSVALLAGDRTIVVFDGPELKQVSLSHQRERTLYRVPEGRRRTPGFALSEDGQHAVFVETDGHRHRLQLLRLARPTATTVVESTEPLSAPMPRPRRAGILYRRGAGMLRVVAYDGTLDRALKLAPGDLGQALWAADGRTVLYLGRPPEHGKPWTLRENAPDAAADRLVAPTSQFAAFGRNSDSSMFVGASSNPGAPYLLLLLGAARRELTLCEHRASTGFNVSPRFAPSSQKVFFQSDRDGKPALYMMNVERFVEQTDEDEDK